ncbi:DUF2865 domain-containing protein [Mesorhizobium sp. A556]
MARGTSKTAFFALALLGALAVSFADIGTAFAASSACRQLEAELASAGSGGRARPSQIRKYDSAIARQGAEMTKARSRARQAGCGFSIFAGNVSACAALNASLDRMAKNLDTLRRDRAKLAKGTARRDRSQIMAALKAKKCRATETAAKELPERKKTGDWLLEKPQRNIDLDDELQAEPVEPADKGYLNTLTRVTTAEAPRGEFRTMCVRTCDGYFFPMSNAASLRDFERDQKNCESSCPGTEMQVFYTRGIADDSANMTSSVTGRPYTELPTAYLYKKPSNPDAPACGCNAAQGFDVIGGRSVTGLQSSKPESPSITSFAPLPAAKPSPAEPVKPAPDEASHVLEPDNQPSLLATDRKVRVVAPAFLPAPEAAIDLQVPGPTPAR